MRELEFVPSWYPRMRRRKRWLKLQLVLTGVILMTLAGWVIETRAAVQAGRDLRAQLDMKLTQSSEELQLLNEQVELKAKLQRQKQIMDRVGRHVEASRMLALFEKTLTPEMSVLELKMDTVESIRKAGGGVERDSHAATPLDRRLQVSVVGVAPTDLDISEFLDRLNKVRFCENVQLLEASDMARDGHRMRKYEVTFFVNLGEGGLQ